MQQARKIGESPSVRRAGRAFIRCIVTYILPHEDTVAYVKKLPPEKVAIVRASAVAPNSCYAMSCV